MKFLFFSFFQLLICSYSFSQINGYARVSAIAGTSLTVANVNQTAHSFAVGNWVVIMQMQDNVIGTNTADNVNFGNLGTIASAGLYEIRRILSINGNSTAGFTTGAPTTIVLNSLGNTYNINANSRVQLITFRQMSATNYTTTANITALAWDGNVGGVIAMEVPGILTLNHNITANGAGFRGGAVSNAFTGTNCSQTPYRGNNANSGWKGEGIYRSNSTTYNNHRAKILNGGGGGNDHNGGGGGGGNFTAGGSGGSGYNNGGNCGNPGGSGLGGISLSAQISNNRIFMGGGGGGGQQNNNVSTNGGNGGGIILVKAGTITTSGACAERIISANGTSAGSSGNDGAGGAGAGGTIVLDVENWSILATCDLFVQSNGGTGGTVNSDTHGGGGAGGQGVVQYNGPQPTTNITTSTLNGTAGCNNSSNPCNNFAGSASGTNNSGITAGVNVPLPIDLTYFSATLFEEDKVRLDFQTASETNTDYFLIEKSLDGFSWETVVTLTAAGNSSISMDYTAIDTRPFRGISYYKLTQFDLNGDNKSFGVRSVIRDGEEITVFPNPANERIEFQGPIGDGEKIELIDVFGKNIYHTVFCEVQSENHLVLKIENLSKGLYFLRTSAGTVRFVKN